MANHPRSYSPGTLEALTLLGSQIRLARKQRKMTVGVAVWRAAVLKMREESLLIAGRSVQKMQYDAFLAAINSLIPSYRCFQAITDTLCQ